MKMRACSLTLASQEGVETQTAAERKAHKEAKKAEKAARAVKTQAEGESSSKKKKKKSEE